MNKVRHVLGISGGKDSAALAIYLKIKYPQLDIEYYSADTGRELDETYQLIDNLSIFLGKEIKIISAAENSPETPFDHFLKMYGGFLPSSNSRWCTKKLKLEPFEKYVSDDLVISYVGIRGDEERDGYISRKQNIQSIFPFRKNIWSEDVVTKAFDNKNIGKLCNLVDNLGLEKRADSFKELICKNTSFVFPITKKINYLLDLGIKEFNYIIFEFLKTTNYPLSGINAFPLLENEEIIVREDVFRILEESGVGVPSYYKEVEFSIDGEIGKYSRSRSGCFFCFFQQKIEWVWLYEQHLDLFQKAIEYEKDGYTWMQDESLEELIKPERIKQIKRQQLKRIKNISSQQSPYLIDILAEAEGEGCASCFI